MMNPEKLQEWARRVHKNACAHGFHDEKKSDAHWLCMVMTEIAEAVEADRKHRRANSDEMKELFRIADKGKLQVTERWYRDFFPIHFDEYVKGSIEEEFADICIRIMDFAYEKYGEDMKWWKWEKNGELHESTFTEKAYTLLVWMTDATDTDTLSLLISFVYDWAESLSIDLGWFIEMKMRYNESRPAKHGKAY